MARPIVTWATVCGLAMLPAVVLGAAEERRFKQLTMQDLSPEQRHAAGPAVAMSSAGLQGLYNVMLRSPGLSERLLPLEEYVRVKTSLPAKLNEFAILIQARLWTSQEVWKAHYPLAIKAGLPETVAADLRVGRRPAGMQPDVLAVYNLCSELSLTPKHPSV